MTNTEKELLQKAKTIRDNFYREPVEPEHKDELRISFEFLTEVINYLENDNNELQKDNKKMKEALTKIASNVEYSKSEKKYKFLPTEEEQIAIETLAAIEGVK